MADTFTPNYEFVLPEIGGSLDTWGNKLNDNFGRVDETLNVVMPPGGIIMWSGSVASIPEGWALCDGAQGTPDLRGRFVVGAGGDYAPGDTGGADSVTLSESQIPSHNHTMDGAGAHSHTAAGNGSHSHSGTTSNSGGHSHTVPTYGASSGTQGNRISRYNTIGTQATSASTLSAGIHSHSFNTNTVGNHSHTISAVSDHTHAINSAGGDESHENRPPYYALAYIMRLPSQ